ncbi:hypothetical protein SASC598J21_000060, partial [Snodgrassella alvi SCGC AB-598-J21]
LPHPQLCPEGKVLSDIPTVTSICDALLEHDMRSDQCYIFLSNVLL